MAWIAGAGYVGARLAQSLRRIGWEVVVFRRNAGPGEVACDFTTESWSRLRLGRLPAPDVSWSALAPGPGNDPAERARCHVHGTRNFGAMVRRRSPGCSQVTVGTTGVYQRDDGAMVEESSLDVVLAGSGRGEDLVEPHRSQLMELARLRDAGQPVRLVVSAGILGPGRTAARRIATGAARGGGAWINLIHVDDLVSILVRAPACLPEGCAVHAVNDDPGTVRRYHRWNAFLWGLQPPKNDGRPDVRRGRRAAACRRRAMFPDLRPRDLWWSLVMIRKAERALVGPGVS